MTTSIYQQSNGAHSYLTYIVDRLSSPREWEKETPIRNYLTMSLRCARNAGMPTSLITQISGLSVHINDLATQIDAGLRPSVAGMAIIMRSVIQSVRMWHLQHAAHVIDCGDELQKTLTDIRAASPLYYRNHTDEMVITEALKVVLKMDSRDYSIALNEYDTDVEAVKEREIAEQQSR